MGEYSTDQSWKEELKKGDQIDGFDKAKVWYASTILEFREHTEPDGRSWMLTLIGFRVYNPNGAKTDDEGKKFDGWSQRFDEWVPLWSPKVAKLHSHTKPKGGKNSRFYEDTIIDDASDPQVREGENPIFAVLRPRKSKSYLLIECLNLFGSQGGYDKMLDIMNDRENPIDFTLLAHYMDCIGKVFPMYHRDFVKTFASDVKTAVENAILNAPEASIRNVRREKIDGIISKLNDLLKRIYTYDQRDTEIEHLNLSIILMCLKSNFLERRIQGIKGLSEALKNIKFTMTNKISAEFMKQWLSDHKILEIIFDQKNYHVQIIQRSKEILKFLIVENSLGDAELSMFWKATEFDDETRREMFKIIHEVSTPMTTEHKIQFLNKFKEDTKAKIIPEAVDCIYEMGKFTSGSFENAQSVAELLWKFAVDESNPLEVSNLSITKLCDLLKKWKYTVAKPFFYNCLENLKNNKATIESIKVMKKIFRDVEYVLTRLRHDGDQERNDDAEESNTGDDQEQPETQQVAEESKEDENIICTSACILHFIEKEDLIKVFLDNFIEYSKTTQKLLDQVKDKSKVQEYVFSGRYDHKTNITERLEFLKFLAAHSSYTISRNEVDKIWSFLIDKSEIEYDEEAVFKWLKESCETDIGSAQVWQLQDIGEIFNERLGQGSNDMGSLTLDGFCCIQSYFLLANESSEKLKRFKKQVAKSSSMMTSYSSSAGPQFSSQFSFSRNRARFTETEEESTFRVHVLPKDLDGIVNIWKIVINSQNANVKQKAISFLIELHHNLAPAIEEQKKSINNDCLKTALNYIKEIQEDSSKSEEVKSEQIISVLKIFDEFLSQSEKKGTTGLKQQRSLLKGELLDKISINNSVSYNKLIGRRIEVSMYSNATVYDIKRVIGAINKVPAEYVRLIRGASTTNEIKDIDNGKTLADLSFKPNESLTATKQNMGNVPKAPLMNPDKTLTPEAQKIFGEWFDTFSHDGLMTPEDCAEFIRSCTDDKCKTDDGRVKNLFRDHDHDNDGKVEKSEFVEFYRQACIRKEEVVRSNILAHNYRNDLRKISDMCEENTDKTLLPRYILSHTPEYFDCLFSLLDRPDDSSKEAWKLIQKLVTNPVLESKILSLNIEKNDQGEYDWDTLIDTKSIFKLLYMFQIVESLIEEGGDEASEVCKVYKNKEPAKAKDARTQQSAGQSNKKQEEEDEKQKEKDNKKKAEDENKPAEFLVSELLTYSEQVENIDEIKKQEAEQKELKKTWIFRFLEKNGFGFAYGLFSQKQKDIRDMNAFEKIFLGFILKILRIFITSAFLAVEPEVANIVSMIQKQASTIKPDEPENNEEEWPMDNDEENIYSTPTSKKSKSRNDFQVVDLSGGMSLVTEDYLFSRYEDVDSDKASASASVEEVKMTKKESTFTKQQKQKEATVDKKIELLAAQLKGELGNNLLKVIDFNQLQQIILQSIASLLVKYEIDFDERKIVENSLSLWLGCSLHNPKILDNFFTFSCNEFPSVRDLILRGILYPSLFKIREEFLYTIYLFATKITNASTDTFEYILTSMLEKLPKDNEGEESCTAQYFELVSKLIEEYFLRVNDGKTSTSILDAPKFFEDVIDRIKSHQSREVRNSPKQDETLIGYLKIAHMVLDRAGLGECVSIAIKKDFISELFQKCLFPNNLSAVDEDVTEGTDLAESLLVGNKCKTDESRKWAYKLLWTLCNNSPKLLNEVIEKQMFPLCKQIKLYPGWNYIPSGDSKSGKYVGIRNLGCICYMNSMVQQLYMVPAFRYQLLRVDDGKEPDWKDYKGRTIDDNVLHQIQRLFGHLELSERVDYNPIEFCFSFKEMDGTPTNTSVQKDTEEFCNIIFDRIENLIKPSPQKYLLQSVFGGKNCSQIVCSECNFTRNRFEDFFHLPVTVKELKTLQESLHKTIQGEVISDYECPGCKKKVDVTKRTLISKTPNVLIVQLQRIVFDFDTFTNQKVNTHFEFPEHLDLNEYSLNHIMKQEGKLKKKDLGEPSSPGKDDGSESEQEDEAEGDEFEGLTEEEKQEKIEERETYIEQIRNNENECYEYKLVGIIIHVGSADAGHYYSLINTDRFKKGNEHEDEWLDTSKDKWMEFNDSHVKDYNYEDLKGDCYGGSAGNDDLFGGFFKSSSYGKSAYLLVYEKRYKKPIKVLVLDEQEQTEGASKEGLEGEDTAKSRSTSQPIPENAVIQTDTKTNEKFYEVPMKDVGLFVPSKIYKDIWDDNLDFSFEKLIYSKEFYEFVRELMLGTLKLKEKEDSLSEDEKQLTNTIISNMSIIGNKLVLEVLAKAFYNYKMSDVTDILIKLYQASDDAVLNMMRSILNEESSNDMVYVFQILLNCSDKISRANTSKLVSALVNRCFEIEKDYLDEEEKVQILIDDDEDVIQTGPSDDDKEPEKKEPRYAEITRPKSLAVRFWDLTMLVLKEKAPSCWSKFDHFLAMIKNIAIGGEAQIDIVMKKNGLIDFVDFMLGQNSPYAKPGERRPKMGSVYGSPNFGPLLEAVSHMIVRCYTPQFGADSEDVPPTAAKDIPKYYELSKEDISKLILHDDFLKISIANSSQALGEAFAHLSYKNLEVSKAIGKIILKTINTSDYEKIKQCMTVCKPYLYIPDEFQRNRVEWILGFSCLNTMSAIHGNLHKFGTAVVNQISDEAYNYISPIECNKNNDALLALLWRYRGRMDFYVINCLNILLEIIVENQFLLEYMFNLDPPTYEYARFTDWFRPYLEKELEKARRNMTYRHSTKKEEQIVKCFGFLEVYEAKLKEYENKLQDITEEDKQSEASTQVTQETAKQEEPADTKPEPVQKKVGFQDEQPEIDDEEIVSQPTQEKVIQHFPQKYVIGCTHKLEEISREERDGIIVVVQKVFVEYADSQPTLNGNKTLPSYAFYNSKVDAEEFDKKHQLNSKKMFSETGGFDIEDTEGVDDSDDINRDDPEISGSEARKQAPNITVSRVGEETDVKEGVSQVNITSKNQDDDEEFGANEQDPDDPKEDQSDWNLPKKVGDVILAVIVQNSTTKGHSMRLRIVCDDDLAKTNIKTPINEIAAYIRPTYYDMWLCVQKAYPEQDWGEFHVEWEANEEVPEIRQNMRSTGSYGGYREDGDDYDAYSSHMYGSNNFNMNFYSIV